VRMSRRLRSYPALILLGIVTVVGVACRATPVPEHPREQVEPEQYVSGCVSKEHTFRELLEACAREDGTEFLLLDNVERDFPRMNFTQISCFVAKGTKASELTVWANIGIVQNTVLRTREKEGLDWMIDRDPLPDTNTYRIYRLPLGAQTPWDSGANGR